MLTTIITSTILEPFPACSQYEVFPPWELKHLTLTCYTWKSTEREGVIFANDIINMIKNIPGKRDLVGAMGSWIVKTSQ